MRRGRNAFTFVELLVVLAIVVLVIGFVARAVVGVRRSADRQRAGAEAHALLQAVKEYRAVFGRWPGQTHGDADEALLGEDHERLIEAFTNTPAGQAILDMPEAVIRNGCWNDPWGRSLVIAFDQDGDARTTIRATNSLFPGAVLNTDIVDTAAVVSWGPEPANDAKRVYTWRR